MPNPLDQLTTLTGLHHNEMLDIWVSVKANQDKLNTCTKHSFNAVEIGKLGTRYECRHCGGRTDVSSVRWYERGLAHAAPVK